MASFNFRINGDLLDQIHGRLKERGVSLNLIARMGIEGWVAGTIRLNGVDDEPCNAQTFVTIPDRLWAHILAKRNEGLTSSVVLRQVLKQWLDGKWDIGVVVNESQ